MNKLSSVVAAVLLIAGVSANADSGEAATLASVSELTFPAQHQAPDPLVIRHSAGFRNKIVEPFIYRNGVNNKFNKIDSAAVSRLVAPSSLPRSGKATMTGYLRTDFFALADSTATRIAGRLAVTADFGSGTVTTFASNFRQFNTASTP
ncbi:MAG: hypothetical protein GDA49_03990, partial [Rhodospirillales bacterium]|nr:hypothetical protein [Rhodospirillales bacterium]